MKKLHIFLAFIILLSFITLIGCKTSIVKQKDYQKIKTFSTHVSVENEFTASVLWNKTGITAEIISPDALKGLKLEITPESSIAYFENYKIENKSIEQIKILQAIKECFDGMSAGAMSLELDENNTPLSLKIGNKIAYFENCVMEFDED